MTSVLTYHIQRPTYPRWLKDQVARSGVEWVKIMDADKGEAQPFGDEVKYIGRLHFGTGELDKELVHQCAAGAQAWMDIAMQRMIAASWITVWEGPNEPNMGGNDPEERLRASHALADFERERIRLMHDVGLRVASYSIGTGNPPDISHWRILGAGIQDTDYLALHEYGMKWMNWNGYHLGRYQHAVRIMENEGYHVPPILITECGIDLSGDPVNDGWRMRCDSEYEHLAQLAETDRHYCQDPLIEAVCIFTWQHDGWPSFSMGGPMSHMFTNYLQKNNTQQEMMPEDEPATDAATMMVKVRWHTEQAIRALEAMGIDRDSLAMRRMYSLVKLDGRGLMYRLENTLKSGDAMT